MNPQLKNWDNFCNYHTGDWQGSKKRYSPDGKVIKTWDVFTHLHVNQDGTEITHQDELFYSDGTNEIKNYGIYQKPQTNALFLDSTFCWGSKIVKPDSIFIFELGFRFEGKRVLCYFRYDESGKLQYTSTGVEYLKVQDIEQKQNHNTELKKSNQKCTGVLQKMTSDWIISEAIATEWKPIQKLNQDYLTQKLDDNIMAICPEQLESNQSFFIGVDWQINSNLGQRGIGYYEASEFSYFTVENFEYTQS